jgi:hypothetical protein
LKYSSRPIAGLSGTVAVFQHAAALTEHQYHPAAKFRPAHIDRLMQRAGFKSQCSADVVLIAAATYCMMRYRHDSKEAAAATVKAKQCPTPPSITPASVALFMLQHGCPLPQAIGTFAISANFSVRGYASHCVRPTFSRRDLTLFTSESRSKPRVVIQTPTL